MVLLMDHNKAWWSQLYPTSFVGQRANAINELHGKLIIMFSQR